jgi:hypothetical protein
MYVYVDDDVDRLDKSASYSSIGTHLGLLISIKIAETPSRSNIL